MADPSSSPPSCCKDKIVEPAAPSSSDPSSSSPPSCCPEGSIGAVAPSSSSELVGKMISIPRQEKKIVAEMDVYVVEPSFPTTKAIVVGHDVFGIDSGRTKLICDQLCKELGVVVVLPDFFRGGAGGEETSNSFAGFFAPPIKSIPGKGEKEETPKKEEGGFFDKAGKFFKGVLSAPGFYYGVSALKWAEVERELADGVFPLVREKGVTDIGVLGFCWGGWFITHASSLDDVCCGAAFHPSLEVCILVGEDPKTLCEAVKCPQMLLAAANDKPNVKEGGLAETTYATKPFGKDCVFRTFERMPHGWVNRGDLEDSVVKKDVEEAIGMVIEFFRKWLVEKGE